MRLKKLGRKRLSAKRKLLRRVSISGGAKELKKKALKVGALSPEEETRKLLYRQLRHAYLEKHPICEVCSKSVSTQIHHKARRKGKNLHRFFLAVCHECHTWIHDNGDRAKALGYIFDFDPRAATPENMS